MTHETAIHRVDTQSAHGEPEPIAADLAADAINGMLAWFLADCRSNSLFPSRGERFAFHQTDDGGCWLLTFEGNNVSVHREPDKADVTIEAPASVILLFLWRRLAPDQLPASGHRHLLGRYHDLVPSW
jgi:predicted lipid carrier protein YhbT